jgi:tetratricopeptide (TPR) repeat protein
MAESSIKCGQCGAFVELDKLVNGEICPVCDQPARIKNYQTVAAMPAPQVNKYILSFQAQLSENPGDTLLNSSLAICFLKLKLYDKALPFFEKAMVDNFADPDPYFYAAVCLLKGQKAFLQTRPVIDKAVEYLNAALQLEDKAIFYYFLAYIKNDYFERKHLTSKPGWQELLETAKQHGVPEPEIQELYAVMGVDRPAGL